jgi:hypothetical protein
MPQYAYSPNTGEIINTTTPAAWMSTTPIVPPAYDPAISGCFFRNGAWVVVVSTAIADAGVKEKIAVLEQARSLRETVLNRLTGIQLNTASTNTTTLSALQAARLSLLNITTNSGVVAATDGASTKTAIMTAWTTIASTLSAAAPSAASVFIGLGGI